MRDHQYVVPDVPPMFLVERTETTENGLDILRGIGSLLVKHRPSISEVILGFPSRAKYDIYNDRNEQILFAYEESTCCQRYFCSVGRRFTLHILNNNKQEIMQISRDFSCCAGCCWCSYCDGCRQTVTIEAPLGDIIGTVSQEGSCWRSRYTLEDVSKKTSFTVLGPRCICDGPCCCCCRQTKFTVLGNDGETEIGAITKLYSGFMVEALTSADNFICNMPSDLDVKIKAIILSALFTIDFTHFASTPEMESDN